MKLSLVQLIAPWIGGAVGWLAAHGVHLAAADQALITMLAAAALANGAHVIEARLSASAWPTQKSKDPTLPKALLLPLLLAVPLLHGCATVPIQSTDEALYSAQGTYAAVENALAMAVTSGSLSRAKAIALDAKAAKAETMIQSARALEATDPAAAHSKLLEVLTLLQAVQSAIGPVPGALPAGPPAVGAKPGGA